MFVKVFQKILDSSIWEESAPTRVVWITLLVSMDSDGFCQFATVETLARRARLKPCFVRDAVAILEAPDDSSSTPGEGRRINRVAGGWVVINAKKYRDISSNRELNKSRRNTSQLVTTRNNTSQHVTSFPASPLGSTKAVTEVEVEVEVEVDREVKIKNTPVAKATVPFSDCHDVYLAYPRKIGKGAALKAIDKAVKRLLAGEASNPISNRDEAVVYLCQRAALFARSPAGNNGDFTPHPATWFNRSSYLDDESEWSKSGSGENGNGKQTKLDQWIESAERELADSEKAPSGHEGPVLGRR